VKGLNQLRATSVLVLVAACAAHPSARASDDPPPQPSAAAPAQSPPVSPAGPASSSATATNGVAGGKADAHGIASKPGRKVLVDDTVTDEQLKQILAKGYTPQMQGHGNEVYYCRSEYELGSRFKTKTCRTAAKIMQDEALGKEATTNVERTGGDRPIP
jgi:hypothetical protein